MRAVRKVIRIDEEKCDGCGECETACAEGAIRVVDGKAKLVKESWCDGLGACLGECPQGAITMEEREADEFVEPPQVMKAHGHGHGHGHGHAGGACPGSAVRRFAAVTAPAAASTEPGDQPPPSRLGHWPVQLMLVPERAPFLAGADLVVCADCVPFAVPDFHERYLAGRAVLVGCPKLDDLGYYREKLEGLLATARPAKVTVLRMEVPCCGGIAHAVIEARDAVLPDLPVEVHVVGVGGGIRSAAV
ncbi:MAG: 4Fe-4S binding protein [Deltaproteobacteria bacterium]|nr:4Fe-4S binding protein [Deltaproteobacteria bacterium]